MPGENIQDWSTTALTNGNADSSINWAEGMPRASVNNSARSMMAAHAKNRNLQNGSIVTTGTANAQAFLSGMSYSTVPTGLRVLLKIGAGLTNTGTITLDMDSIGGVTVKDQFANNLLSGALIAGSYAEFCYNGVNWILLGSPGTQMIHGGDGTTSLPSGYVGEYYETTNAFAAVLTSNIYTNLHVATMNAGDWDIRGKVRLDGGTAGAGVYLSLSLTTGSSGTPDSISTNFFTINGDTWFSVGPTRFVYTAALPIYLNCFPIGFGCSLNTAIIQARRIQ